MKQILWIFLISLSINLNSLERVVNLKSNSTLIKKNTKVKFEKNFSIHKSENVCKNITAKYLVDEFYWKLLNKK